MEKLSPQVRIFALVAALAAVGGLLFVFMSGRGSAAEPELAAPPPMRELQPRKPAKAPAVHKTAVSGQGQAAKAKPAKPRAPAKAAKAAPKKVVPKLPATGFPLAVDRALAKHKVVVVSLVVPGSLSTSSRPARRRQERSSAAPAIWR